VIFAHADRVLIWPAGAHVLVAVGCMAALFANLDVAAAIMGVHPASKPLKFALSIALFLATMAVILPAVSVNPVARRAIAWILALTMITEIVLIVLQAVRGTTSHFNARGLLNSAIWNTMAGAIVIATLTMGIVALLATLQPLTSPGDVPMDPLRSTAWRAALWLFLLAAFSGFSMAGRMQHSVGGEDGGPGLPLVNWSTRHGDLRVSHFVAMHALQLLPIIAAGLMRAPLGGIVRWSGLILSIIVIAGIAIGTFVQASASRAVW